MSQRFNRSHNLSGHQKHGQYSRRGSTKLPPYLVLPATGLGLSLMYAYFCCVDAAPFTNRRRLIATSVEWEGQLGDKEYQQLLKKFHRDILPRDHRASQTVERVGTRLSLAANRFGKKYVKDGTMYKGPYTFTVVRSEMANAFVLPNNHVFVLTGLFKYARDEDDLAAIMGHEIAHNIARHAGEKISGSLLVSILARLTLIIDPSGFLYSIFLPTASLFHDLPNSREAEVEADHIGIHLAADACYDPRSAKRVFSRMKEGMAKETAGSRVQPPEFLSTHPSYDARLTNFDQWLPEALKKFNGDDGYRCTKVREEMKISRRHAALVASQRE